MPSVVSMRCSRVRRRRWVTDFRWSRCPDAQSQDSSPPAPRVKLDDGRGRSQAAALKAVQEGARVAAPAILDDVAEAGDPRRRCGSAVPGYHGVRPASARRSTIASCNGIPSADEVPLGDLVSDRLWCHPDGWHGDAAVTLESDPIDADEAPSAATRHSPRSGIAAMVG